MSQRILIVGAGIAGLATAVALQRIGYPVAVLEEKADTSAGAGISIWPNALAALDALGLGDAVRGSGGRVTAGALRWRDGAWLRRPSADRMVRALGEPLVVTRRADLTGILADALTPGTVRRGVAARGIESAPGGMRVTLSDGAVHEATAVIGADGVGSMVARHLNGPLRHRYAGYTAWRGISRHRLDPELAGQTLGAGTEVGHVPLGSDHTYWFATERTAEGGATPGGELEYLRGKYRDWAEPIPSLLAATAAADVLRNDLYDRDQAAHLVARSGDAGGRRRTSHAAASGSGWLSGSRGRSRPGTVRGGRHGRPDRLPDRLQPVRSVSAVPGCGHSSGSRS